MITLLILIFIIFGWYVLVIKPIILIRKEKLDFESIILLNQHFEIGVIHRNEQIFIEKIKNLIFKGYLISLSIRDGLNIDPDYIVLTIKGFGLVIDTRNIFLVWKIFAKR